MANQNRNQQPAPFQGPALIQKPYWTATRIVAVVLVAVLVSGVAGFATRNYLSNSSSSPSGSSNTCTNGATNLPLCSNNTCSNGANNYPQCTVYGTSLSIGCTPDAVETHQLTNTSCIVAVTSYRAPTEASGSVGFTATGTSYWHSNGAPCTLTLAVGYAYCRLANVT